VDLGRNPIPQRPDQAPQWNRGENRLGTNCDPRGRLARWGEQIPDDHVPSVLLAQPHFFDFGSIEDFSSECLYLLGQSGGHHVRTSPNRPRRRGVARKSRRQKRPHRQIGGGWGEILERLAPILFQIGLDDELAEGGAEASPDDFGGIRWRGG